MKRIGLDVERFHLLVGDFDAGRVSSAIQFCLDLESLARLRVRDQLDDYLMAGKRTATPILSYVAEHLVLNSVPFAGAEREVSDTDLYPQFIRQTLQFHFPESASGPITTAPIGNDQ